VKKEMIELKAANLSVGKNHKQEYIPPGKLFLLAVVEQRKIPDVCS